MSGVRKNYNDGEALNTIDFNLTTQAQAAADDRAFAALFADASNSKRVWPLADTDYDGANLVVTGSTIGTLSLLPCTLIAGNSTNPRAVELSATLESALQSDLVAANSSGSTRVDLIYATIQRTSPSTLASAPTGTAYAGKNGVDLRSYPSAIASRTVKSPTSGSVTTQTITVVQIPTITLNILQGTPGGGAPSLPADTAPTGAVTDGIYNFSLATLSVANGYTSGGSINQSDITPTWTKATIPELKALEAGTRTVSGLLIDGTGGNPNQLAARPRHIVVTRNSPGVSAGTGAGTSPTISITGSDTVFQLSVTTGSTPSTSAAIATISFVNAFHAAPAILYAPQNANAAALSGAKMPFPTSAAGASFVWESGSTALDAATTYVWHFWCVDYSQTVP